MTDVITIPVSFGEVLDKITILEIKSERISDTAKLANVRRELEVLAETWAAAVPDESAIEGLRQQLKAVNQSLWDIEDEIRDCERARNYGEKFIELARGVYFTNDKRAELKKDINLALGSRYVEEKSYQDYSGGA